MLTLNHMQMNIYIYICYVHKFSVSSWIQTYRQSENSTRYQLSQMTSPNNTLQTNSPQNFRLYDPTTWNLDRTWFNSKLRLHIHLWSFCQNKWLLWEPLARKHHTIIRINILSRLPVSDTIWPTFSDLTWFCKFNLDHFFWFDSPFHVLLNFLNLNTLIISNSIWLNFPIWFDYNYINCTHRFKFESDILIQFDSSFLIQLDSFILFDLKHTTRIWIISSDLTQLLWFNLSQHLLFNFNQFSDLI